MLDGGPDQMNPVAAPRDDKSAMRPFAKLLLIIVTICCSFSCCILLRHFPAVE